MIRPSQNSAPSALCDPKPMCSILQKVQFSDASSSADANGFSDILGSLSNDDGNGNENVTRKYIFTSFVLLRDYFNSLNFFTKMANYPEIKLVGVACKLSQSVSQSVSSVSQSVQSISQSVQSVSQSVSDSNCQSKAKPISLVRQLVCQSLGQSVSLAI